MLEELTATELKESWITYLKREIDTHKRDIISNQGKVQEDEELLIRVQNTCVCCGEYIYPSSDTNRMAQHITAKHTEERKAEAELT